MIGLSTFLALVYEVSRWINRNGEIIPQSSLDKPPSAELRPNQIDQDSLPPYHVLDCILESYIEENAGAEEIAKKENLPLALVEDVIRRVHRAEYKRQQAAPNLRVSAKAFNVGRVFPIAQKYWS